MTNRPVNVITSREARQHLGTMLDRFRRGENEPMIFGAQRRPEGVVISFEEYMRLLDLEEAHRREEELVEEVRERLGGPTVAMSVDELAESLGPVAVTLLHEAQQDGGEALPAAANG